MLIREILGRDHEVVTAETGARAKKILDVDQGFDSIIFDLMMPELSGMDLHDWLAVTHPHLAERVIFVTGGAFTPRAAEHLRRCDNLRLEKPFNLNNLKKIVDERVAAIRGEK